MPAANVENFPGVIGTFMGRDALRLVVSRLELGPADTVLLPAYLCTEVLRPFMERCRVQLFDVCPDTSVDPSEVEQRLIQSGARVVLLLNYFGFLQPHRVQIKQICGNRNALLIEDCAHSLLTAGSGETGDMIIHSFRKILPLPDGGGLRPNSHPERFNPRFRSRALSNILSVLIMLKSLLRVRSLAFSRAGLSARTDNLIPTAPSVQRNLRCLPMSSFARNRLRRLDFGKIIARRRSDYEFWSKWVLKRDGLRPLFPNLPAGVCPLGFPVLVHDRHALKTRLEHAGVLVRTHWHLAPTVGPEFVNSHRLADQSLTLPLYPEFGEKERLRVQNL